MRSGSFFEQNTLKEKAKLLKLPKRVIFDNLSNFAVSFSIAGLSKTLTAG